MAIGWKNLMLASGVAASLLGCQAGTLNTLAEEERVTNASASQGALTEQDGVYQYQLSNGLKLLVKPDHRAPIVVSQIWYRVGASYESGGHTGVSHVLEHMMFKGTKKLESGEFSRIIAENGGRENAFTGRDYTAYFQTLEKSRLPISFELEAERMRNLQLDKQEFNKERMVVMEERRWRTEDKPESLTYERFLATAYENSGYHHPIIGWMGDLKNLTLDDLSHWYQNYYAPNNAVLVVAGDVQPGAVYRLAKKYFGPLKPSELQPIKPRKEREQLGIKRIEVNIPAERPYLIMGYKVPVINTADEPWEPYALDVLAGILDGGDSARIPRSLVREQQIAASAGAGYTMDERLQTLFILEGTPATGRNIDEVEQALREEIVRLKQQTVTDQELDKIKAQVIASNVYEQDSVFYQAMKLGKAEMVGVGWQQANDYVEQIKQVTAEQVQAVAQKYLVDQGLTVAVLMPKSPDSDSNSATGAAAAKD